MKGVARTALLLLCWSAMTRWLLVIGLVLTGLGVGGVAAATHSAGRSLFAVVTFMGVITAVISPVLMGGVVLRCLSAPRTIELIPHGRLQLLLGAFVTQLLLAMFIGGVFVVMSAVKSGPQPVLPAGPGGALAPLFACSWAVLTLQFIGYYLVSASRFGGIWLLTWAVWPRLMSAAFQYWHIRGLFAAPAGSAAMLAVVLLAWLAFAIAYLMARQVPMPHRNTIGVGARRRSDLTPQHSGIPPERRFSHLEAIRWVLAGGARQQRVMVGTLAAWIAILLAAVAMRSRLPPGAGHAIVGLLCMMAGPLTGSFAGLMAQRAKPLWLQSGLGRRELFAAVEARSWRAVLPASVLCAALAAGWLVLTGQPLQLSAWSAGVLVTPLASGALFTYAQLQLVRGRRVADLLLLGLAIGLWMSEFFSMVVGAGLPVVADLLAAQIILVPVLRILALRRWERLDWIIQRGAGNPWGLA